MQQGNDEVCEKNFDAVERPYAPGFLAMRNVAAMMATGRSVALDGWNILSIVPPQS
jgi:deoxyinosine 3'endonuclease (endonuclease V)